MATENKKATATASKAVEATNKKATATTAVETTVLTDMVSVERRTSSKGKTYTIIQAYHCPNKDNAGAVGVKLEATPISRVIAHVKGVKVIITEDNNGKCKLVNPKNVKDGFVSAADYQLCKGLNNASFKAVATFLESKYCLSQRDFNAIKELALNGTPLLTKSERKELAKAANA